jgi:hypothetical protein
MIKLLGGAVVLAALLTVSGCGGAGTAGPNKSVSAAASAAASPPAGDTVAVCARWMKAQLPYLSNTAPEAKAYAKAVADSYQGNETAGALEVQLAFWSAWADAVRPLAAEAAAPELQAALTTQVEELDRRAAGGRIDSTQMPFAPVQELCSKG